MRVALHVLLWLATTNQTLLACSQPIAPQEVGPNGRALMETVTPTAASTVGSTLGSAAGCVDFDDSVLVVTGGFDCAAIAAYAQCDIYMCPTCSLGGFCDLSCGYCTAPSSTSAVPTVSAVPSLSSVPTPLPTAPGPIQLVNITNFTALKKAVENAPACGSAQVQVTARI